MKAYSRKSEPRPKSIECNCGTRTDDFYSEGGKYFCEPCWISHIQRATRAFVGNREKDRICAVDRISQTPAKSPYVKY